MTRIGNNIFGLSLAALIVLNTSGCRWHRSNQPNCCPPYISGRTSLTVTTKPAGAGVSSDFAAISSYEHVQRFPFYQLTSAQLVPIELDEVLCLAARNSELADLIEAERHALQCRVDDCEANPLELVLQGEALEQRNQAAGDAAALFLGLVGIDLQRELINESTQRLNELNETINAAAAAGFATSTGKTELAEGLVRLKTAVSEVDAAEQRFLFQLNLLINPDTQNPVVLRPVYELAPRFLDVDVRKQIQFAESNRPGILGLESAIEIGINTKDIVELLSQFAPQLGAKPTQHPVKAFFLRRILKKNMEADKEADAASQTRQAQVTKILESKKKLARTEAAESVLQIQNAVEKLSIQNENIARLTAKADQLKAQQQLDSQNSYLEFNQNWQELQQAKSDRIEAAIEQETAKIRLLQAQGRLAQPCQSDSSGLLQIVH